MAEPLLRISHLTKRFGNATVVDDLSLEIMPGECLGVIGPNGAGKTTTIRICLGLSGPDAGEITAFGLPLPARVREAKKRIGVVTQFDSLDPDFTCAENLRVYGAYFGGGLGVIILAVLGIFLADHLQRLNGLKTSMSLIINTVALVAFGLFGPVHWLSAAIVAPASLVGGYAGGRFARRLSSGALRAVVVVFGVVVAIWLFAR